MSRARTSTPTTSARSATSPSTFTCYPATSTTYFRGTGGLFRFSLEMALNSLQSANAAVFPATGGVERRYVMTPKWQLATFLAGLCCQNYRTINSMVVMTLR
ncbi:MAG: TraI domain-containing protein [Rhodocyclaceae bacterium]|nr:TraI domain-containing protein [Rhodocyclaceae bacterium]